MLKCKMWDYPFGNKWSFNLGAFMLQTPATNAQLVLPGGRFVEYLYSNGQYVAKDRLNRDQFAVTSGLARLTLDMDGHQYFFSTNTQQVVKEADRFGNELLYYYDGQGRLTNVTDSIGRYFTFIYNAAGYVTEVRDMIGRACLFAYTNGTLVSLTDMGGQETRIGYAVNNWITNITYANGYAIHYSYTNGAGMGYPYDDPWYEQFGYPAFRIVASDSLGLTNRYAYSSYSTIGPMMVDDRAGNSWVYGANLTNRTTLFLELVNASNFANYCKSGHTWAWRDMDLAGNVHRQIYPNTPHFDCVGNAMGSFPGTAFYHRVFYYDSNRWITQEVAYVTNSLLFAITNTYDAQGNLLSRTDPMGQITRYTYDASGNLLSTTNALDSGSQMTYDGAGNLTTLTDARGHQTAWSYDSRGLNTNILFPDTTSVRMAYDSIGRLQTYQDAAGWGHDLSYDDLDRVTSRAYSDGTSMAYEYACCGLEKVVDRLGRSTCYEHDLLRRMTAITNALGHAIRFRYNAADKITNLIVYVNGQPRTNRFDYLPTNGFSRLIARTSPLGKNNKYDYTFRGWLSRRTDGNGQISEYRYDPLGRMTAMCYGPATNALVTNVWLHYDKASRITNFADRLGTNTYHYDALGRATNFTSAYKISDFSNISFQLTYGYDPVGNVTSRTVTGLAGFTNVITDFYSYDSMNRLTVVTNAQAWAEYAYDAAGRLSELTPNVWTVFDLR